MLQGIKKAIISAHLKDWHRSDTLHEGYTVILPTPMDMPFLLRVALESLRWIDTTNCRQILVVPDGLGAKSAGALQEVVYAFTDPRVELVHLSTSELRLLRLMRVSGATTHWMQFINGTKRTTSKYAYLHDSDAFFLEASGIERQYADARNGRMHTLGVTARWDPFFMEQGLSIPGTWELMYSVLWARQWDPYEMKGTMRHTPYGYHLFDSMLYPQYADYESGKVGIMTDPPRFEHFSGTICAYREYCRLRRHPVNDELFRLLLLALLEKAVGARENILPPIDQLAAGLTNPEAPISYASPENRIGYAEFRHQVERMCSSPVFEGTRGEAIRHSLGPFDEHFAFNHEASFDCALKPGEMRVVAVH